MNSVIRSRTGRKLGALVAALMLATMPVAALAQDQTAPDTVLATVGGEPITEADLAMAAEEVAGALGQVPAEDQRAFLLAVLIDIKVIAQAARDAGLRDSEEFQARLQYLEDSALRQLYLRDVVDAEVTDEAIQAEYDSYVASMSAEEFSARHILVETEAEAEAIKAELEGGASFEEIAREKSIDTGSGARGGDLGFFDPQIMVAPFRDAVLAMQVGEISEPVESDFGWHVIALEDRRPNTRQPVPLDQIRTQVERQVRFDALGRVVSGLTDKTEIVIPDAALAEAVAAQKAE